MVFDLAVSLGQVNGKHFLRRVDILIFTFFWISVVQATVSNG